MRVLWFSVTPSLYLNGNRGFNGGGWIASLEKQVRELPEIELGIAFELDNVSLFKEVKNKVTYYPINIWNSKKRKLERKLSFKSEEKYIIPECLKIIEDFQPDVIQVFGTEWCFGLISQYTQIPVVIHMQGCVPPCYNARFPIGLNEYDFLFGKGLSLKSRLQLCKADINFRKRAGRDERILRGCNHYMGRTHWDKALIRLYNPKANYYYCSEILRDSFFSMNSRWKYHKTEKIQIVSTLSSPWYKGVDVVLKTAKLLKENSDLDFEWKVFGLRDIQMFEKKLGIKSSEMNVNVVGVVDSDQLVKELLVSQFYVHPSYIDNSPNSVCEAQLLGVPVIATNVGGVSSIVKHEETGFLVPANDPFILADLIISNIHKQKDLESISREEIRIASERHDPKTIIIDLLEAYRSILSRHEEKH